MDSTTKMQVDQIIKQGWYRKSQTLGSGGWAQIPQEWRRNKYVLTLYLDDANVIDIFAKNDETAIKAFHSLYCLDELVAYDIHRVVTKYILIDSNNRGK